MMHRVFRGSAIVALVACAAGALAAVGCGPSNIRELREEADFNDCIKTEPMVLVEFYKGGCPTCGMLEGPLNELAKEYIDRVPFARYEMMTPWFHVRSEDIQKEHRVAYFPTVIFFVNGQEKKRWTLEINMDKYRKVMDEAAGPPKVEPKAEKPADKPKDA
jgi:thiol-disulfide isomerase/thioredoxin